LPITEQANSATRRALVLGLAAAGLSSCIGQTLLMNRQLGFAAGLFARKPRLTREQVAKYAAASISVRMAGGSGEAMVLLNRIEGRDLFWLSIDRVLLVTRGGRLVQTAGLNVNLARTMLPVPDPVDGALLTSDRVYAQRTLDYDDFGLGLEARSRFYVQRKDPIVVLGSTLPTVRVIEEGHVKALKWYFTNTYWVHGETGAVWRSRQHFHPDSSAIVLTTLRPAQVA